MLMGLMTMLLLRLRLRKLLLLEVLRFLIRFTITMIRWGYCIGEATLLFLFSVTECLLTGTFGLPADEKPIARMFIMSAIVKLRLIIAIIIVIIV